MRFTFLIVCSILLSFVFANEVNACKCFVEEAKDRFETAEMVFLGEVIRVKAKGKGLTADIKVIDSWKGLKKSQIRLSTPTTDGGSCGVNFAAGAKMLLWTNGTSTKSCDNAVKNAEEFLAGKQKLTLEKATFNTNKESKGKEDDSDSYNYTFVAIVSIIVSLFAVLVLGAIIVLIFLFVRRRKTKGNIENFDK